MLRRSLVLLMCSGIVGQVCAATVNQGEELFKTTIQPILVENCHKCHSHKADKIKGSLLVDSLAGLLTGGEHGPAIVPGDPEKSLLIKAVRYVDEDLQMPPKGKKLSDEQIRALTEWVKLGAPWPGSETNKVVARGRITDEDRKWWSFQPLRKVEPPRVEDNGWSRNDIDRFIWQKLATEGLKPSPEISRQALIRRVSFDLTGLPPTPAEIDAFVNDSSSDAYEKLIDRL
ncbi:MAG TPA: DUF1549 domain-containing protein, partial [Candidatus Binatia bacterium]|nr:DUF1549 domain-containing protein [Candidatus Binatia bacterium]